ncbi:MAG: hypothetical protein J6P54_02350 [Bacteroidales bacterium]|nr:hypothetical protein [Bacteroidales bacterium]
MTRNSRFTVIPLNGVLVIHGIHNVFDLVIVAVFCIGGTQYIPTFH